MFGLPQDLKSVFHWKHSSWFIALAAGAALTASLADKFALSYIFLFVTAVLSVGCWLTSDTLSRKRSSGMRLYSANGTFLIVSDENLRRWQLIPTICILVFFLLGFWVIRYLQIQKELQAYVGQLVPASDPTPFNPCDPIPPDYLTVFLGNNAAATNHFPHVVLDVGGYPLISLDRSMDGSVAVILTIRSPDGKIVVSMDTTGFTVNEHNQLKFNRPDRSTLTVMDQEERQWLYARYLNKHSFKLDGMIRIPGRGFLPLQLIGMERSCAMSLNGIDISVR
jgi:hypothetical protein